MSRSKKYHIDGRQVHSAVPELCQMLRNQLIDRREFLRTATLLGVASSSAVAVASTLTGTPLIRPAQAAQTPRKGGRFRVAMEVQEIGDPASFAWVQKSNITRHMAEYLTITDANNITHPYLLESLQPNDDLSSWTLKLRPGITWSNGDPLTADDVIFNFKRWLDPSVGSSVLGLLSSMTVTTPTGKTKEDGTPETKTSMREGAIEKIDTLTLRLHLDRPTLTIPETLYHYPALIMHQSFSGEFEKSQIGTGPYELAVYEPGRQALLKRRQRPYWGGEVYLDEIQYIDTGPEESAAIAALASQQVDLIWRFPVSSLEIVHRLPHVRVAEIPTAQTGVVRMQIDQKPFDNPLLRHALCLACDNEKILELAYRNLGSVGENHHVGKGIQPDCAVLPPLKRDVARARALLAQAGYAEGITLSCDVGNTEGPWETDVLQVAKQQAADAGITIDINSMPKNQYWEIWKTTPFGLTSWTHRSLGVMILELGYRSGVAWNETNYANPDFDAALDAAGGILDPIARRSEMKKAQEFLQKDCIMVQPLFRNIYSPVAKNVKEYQIHPTLFHHFRDVWLDDA